VIHSAILHVQETEALYIGIQQLANGYVSHHLLPANKLYWAILDTMALIHKERPHLELIHKTVNYYYDKARFTVALHTNTEEHILFITVLAPVTMRGLTSAVTIWEIVKFPLQAPDNQRYYTLLNTDFRFIGYHYRTKYYFTAKDERELPQDGSIDIHRTDLKIYHRKKLTCALALMSSDFADIQSLCGYKVIFDYLPRSVVRINKNKLLLTNVTELKVFRRERNNVTAVNQNITLIKSQTIFDIPCEGRVTVGNEVFHSNSHCADIELEENYNVTFPINLVVLKQYFNDSLLDDINHSLELNRTVTARLPRLDIEKPEYQNIRSTFHVKHATQHLHPNCLYTITSSYRHLASNYTLLLNDSITCTICWPGAESSYTSICLSFGNSLYVIQRWLNTHRYARIY